MTPANDNEWKPPEPENKEMWEFCKFLMETDASRLMGERK